MAIFQKTEPGLLYELSPGRDGRLLVWSPGLMKYQYCTSLDDMAAVNSNYLEQDIDDGCWFYQLPRLVNGDNMFYNDAMTELYEGRVPLWHFESNLQSLQSGVNMFKGCSLDAVSVKRIADTLSDADPGTITLGIHYSLEGDSSVAASLAKIGSKGWSVEVKYNLPYGYTELEYLESSGTQYMRPYLRVEGLSYRTKATVTKSIVGTVAGYYDTVTPSQGECTSAYTQNGWAANTYTAAIRLRGKDSSRTEQAESFYVPLGTTFETELNWHEGYLRLYTGTETKTTTINVGEGFTNKAREILIGVQSTSVNAWSPDNPIGNSLQGFFVGKLHNFKAWYEPGALYRDLVPALDADGVAGMYDKASKQFFRNIGTGTFGYKIKLTGDEVAPMALRDPYYVAPSGVYARPAGDNELDIVADTDMTADIAEQDGYIWFANTGEAYEHFGVTQQPEGEEVIEA